MDSSQETIDITPELQVVMADLNLPASSIGIGISKGYEARVINEALPVASGNVIWAQKRHLDAFQAHLDAEVAGAFADGRKAAPVPEPIQNIPKKMGAIYTEADLKEAVAIAVEEAMAGHAPSKGKAAYEARMTGQDWYSIGPNSLTNAKAYAKKNGLPWPVKIN